MRAVPLVYGVVATLVTTWCAEDLTAADVNHVRWSNSIDQAWQESQSRGVPLLVFVTRPDCIPCARMKVSTYADRSIAATLNRRFVAVAIDGTRPSPLLKDLAVAAYPVTFVISPDAVILERIDGYVTPQQMAARLEKVTPSRIENAPIRPVSGRAF